MSHLPPPDLLQRIPASARVILDVGCGQGDLGAAYLRMNPTARYLGIEKDPAAAAVAAGYLSEVAVLDVESEPLPFDLSAGVDCIIYCAVLEQLRDPWTLLRQHKQLLRPDGMMLICVPNIEHWSFAEKLLRGTWNYHPSGLLDQHHLRWFSLEGMHQGLLSVGLTLCDVQPRIFDAAESTAFATAMTPALTALGIDPASYARRASALQYIWRVTRQPFEPITVASTMLAPVGGVSHVRVVHPLIAIATEPGVSARVSDTIDSPSAGDDSPRIFILHRPALSGQQGRDILHSLMANGWLIITEFDDNPDFFQVMQGDAQITFRGVHALQTSTPALADVLRRHNPEVAVFPNAIVSLPDVRNFNDLGCLTVFFGALNREQDWHDLMPIINSIAGKAGDRLRFQVVHDRAFFEALESPYKQFTPTCDYETYVRILGGCEISLMPLSDNGFNRAKSDLKFIEAAACRVAPLASHVVYGESIVDGETGLLFRNQHEFRSRLLRLVAMPEMARDVGNAARQYVIDNRMLAYQVGPRLAWYRHLWSRKEELTEALRVRMAESVPLPA